MPRRTAAAWLLGCAALLAGRVLAAPADAAFEKELDQATRMILCDCGCAPQSVHDCACGRADQMRQEIAGQIRSGKTGSQVVDAYVAQYGPKIRIAPTASGFNLVAWIGPAIAFLVCALVGVVVLRRWTRAAAAGESPVSELPAPRPDDPYLARLARHLEEYE